MLAAEVIDVTELSVEELQILAAEQLRQAAATPEPEPVEPEAPPKPKPETWPVTRPIPRDIRLAIWLTDIIGLGTRDGVRSDTGQRLWLWRRLLVCPVRAWPRFRQMLWIVRSGPAADGVFETRSDICDECEYLEIGVRDGEAYCGACNCLDWALSKLRRKNRYRINHCTAKRHPGGYITLATHTYPNRKTRKSGGCGAPTHG